MLCDEPIASLDPKSSRMVMDTLQRLTRQRKITCIVNLHQVDFALEYSDRTIGLRAGQKVFEGTPDEATPQVIRSIYEGQMDEVVDVSINVPAAIPTLVGEGMAVPAEAAGGAR